MYVFDDIYESNFQLILGAQNIRTQEKFIKTSRGGGEQNVAMCPTSTEEEER